MLQGHVRLGLEADASAEDVGQGTPLLGQGVNDGCSGRGHRGLEHVAEDAQDAVEALVVLGGGGLPLDAGHHLGDEDKVDDQRGGEEGVLADVEDTNMGGLTYELGPAFVLKGGWVSFCGKKNSRDGLVASHKDLGVVLIQGALVVTNSRHVLDDDSVVRVLALLV